MGRVSGLLLAIGLALLPASAAGAQATGNRGDSATIYRDSGFRGPAVAVERANPNLRLNFPVQSIRVARGTWELCPEPNFRGRCLTVSQSTQDLRRAHNWPGPLQSMRPVGDGGWGGGGGNTGQSLRGMASEFFPAPRQGNARVPACPTGSATAACAAASANRFCQQQGWRGSARQLMETENRRAYLADVLCVQSGV